MFKKYVVTLREDEREQLRALVSGGKSAARKLNHARILLLTDASQGPARTDQEIVEALGLGGGERSNASDSVLWKKGLRRPWTPNRSPAGPANWRGKLKPT